MSPGRNRREGKRYYKDEEVKCNYHEIYSERYFGNAKYQVSLSL
ncbi:MAG: hypothetical protein QOH65_1304 [Methylobacteriaceae bacterium]|nr:hypothetical protein [Methylobacteriaceae bacterium]